MLPYWTLFAVFLMGALLSVRRQPQLATAAGQGPHRLPDAAGHSPMVRSSLLLAFACLMLLLFVGLRLEVGGDWFNYERIFEEASLRSFDDQLELTDPGFHLLNWAVAQVGGEVWWINIVAALPFVIGLQRLARLQPEPWLVMVVAVPYLIVVVAMGYTRQAAALGFVMMGLAAVIRGAGLFRFALYVLLAALFHRTAIVCLPLMAFVFPQSRYGNLLLIAALSVSLYAIFLQDDLQTLSKNYLEARYSSQGAAIRIAQLTLAATLFFALRKRLGFAATEGRIWRNLSLVTLTAVPILLLSPSSTAVDRLSLYLLPMQVVVLARLPLALTPPLLVRLLVVFYSALVLFVWLNFAAHRRAWVPYDNVLFAG